MAEELEATQLIIEAQKDKYEAAVAEIGDLQREHQQEKEDVLNALRQ
jgi:hypothetical protein